MPKFRATKILTCFALFVSHTLVPTSLPPFPPTPGKQTGKKNGLNAVVWAVPVAIVGLIFIIILVFFIRKSRRLERSMFALMTRRSMDDDGGVTFHSGNGRLIVISILLHVNVTKVRIGQSVCSISDAVECGLSEEKGVLFCRTAAGNRA